MLSKTVFLPFATSPQPTVLENQIFFFFNSVNTLWIWSDMAAVEFLSRAVARQFFMWHPSTSTMLMSALG